MKKYDGNCDRKVLPRKSKRSRSASLQPSTTATTLSHEFPGMKFTFTWRFSGNCVLWSPQKLKVVPLPLDVRVMIVIDTPSLGTALN